MGRHAAEIDAAILPSITPLPMPAPAKARALLRMKLFATSLLLVAAAGYVLIVTLTDGDGVWGYLKATAEASMVGGLADLASPSPRCSVIRWVWPRFRTPRSFRARRTRSARRSPTSSASSS